MLIRKKGDLWTWKWDRRGIMKDIHTIKHILCVYGLLDAIMYANKHFKHADSRELLVASWTGL